MKSMYKYNLGYSLIEIIFSLMITAIATLAFGTFAFLISKVDSDVSKTMKLTDIKSNIFLMFSDKRVWNQIVSSANMDYPLDNSLKVNPELVCVRDKTECIPGEYPLTVLDQLGKIYFDSLDTRLGFNKKGDLCNSFDALNEDPECPFQLKIKWKPVCPSSGTCIDPQIQISVQTVAAVNSQNINISNQITSMSIENPIELPPYIKAGVSYTNATAEAGDHDVIYDVSPNVTTNGSTAWTLSLDGSMITSTYGGSVSLVDSTTIKYSAPNNFYGLDKVRFKITANSSGMSGIGVLYVKVMTPYTWTGLAGGGDLNTSNLRNFCGKVVNGICDQVSFPTIPTGTLGKFVFNNTCSNCNGVINSNSYTLEFASTFPGTMNSRNLVSMSTRDIVFNGGNLIQEQGDIRITGSSWVQNGGNFTGSSSYNIYFDNDTTLAINGGVFKAANLMSFGSRNDRVKTFLTLAGSGQFQHNNGTVLFYGDASGSCTHKAWSISAPTINLYNLSFSAVDTCRGYMGDSELLTSAGSKVIVENNFTLARGTLSGNLDLLGNLIIGNNSTPADSKGTVNIVGNRAQTYTYSLTGKGPKISMNTTGSFSPAPGTTNLNLTSLNVVAGTFNAPTGTLTLGTQGDTTMIALGITDPAQFVHNNGTVQFFGDTSGSCSHKSWTISAPTLNLYNLTHNAADTCSGYAGDADLITSAGTRVIVENTFTLARGKLSGTIDLLGNLVVGSNGPSDSLGIVNIVGNNAQTYTYGSSGSGPHIVMNTTGSFSPAAGTTNLKVTSLNITSGTFNAPTGTISFGTQADTTLVALGIKNPTQFVHNNGTVQFAGAGSGSCGSKRWTVDTSVSPINIYNLVLNAINTCGDSEISISGASPLVVENDSIFIRGSLNGPVSFKGNLTSNSGFGNGNASMTFSGNGAQIVTLNGGLPRGNMTIDKPGGMVRLASDMTLSGSAQSLHLKNGNIDMAGNNLRVSDGSGLDNVLTLESGTVITRSSGTLTYEKITNLGGQINP